MKVASAEHVVHQPQLAAQGMLQVVGKDAVERVRLMAGELREALRGAVGPVERWIERRDDEVDEGVFALGIGAGPDAAQADAVDRIAADDRGRGAADIANEGQRGRNLRLVRSWPGHPSGTPSTDETIHM